MPDDYSTGPRLVVLPVDGAYSRSETNQAFTAAEEILRHRGDQPRQKQNRLIFLAADYDVDAAAKIEAGLESGELHPNEAKRHLARSVVALYWGEGAASEAEQAFDQVFKQGGTPDDLAEFQLPDDEAISLPGVIRDVFAVSGNEARRLISQGAVRLDDEVVSDQELDRHALAGKVLRVGKRRFVQLSD